jgi:hypothetical protein
LRREPCLGVGRTIKSFLVRRYDYVMINIHSIEHVYGNQDYRLIFDIYPAEEGNFPDLICSKPHPTC